MQKLYVIVVEAPDDFVSICYGTREPFITSRMESAVAKRQELEEYALEMEWEVKYTVCEISPVVVE